MVRKLVCLLMNNFLSLKKSFLVNKDRIHPDIIFIYITVTDFILITPVQFASPLPNIK